MTHLLISIALSILAFVIATVSLILGFKRKRKRLYYISLFSFLTSLIFTVWFAILTTKKTYYKAEEIISKHTRTDSTKKKQSEHSLFADYDIDKPDTEGNRDCFEKYLKIKINQSVKGIFCYADFLGADYTIQMSFKCDTATLNEIISKNQLLKDDVVGGRNLDREFPWWNEAKIDNLYPFIAFKENELYRYLWFDPKDKRAYYLEYSL